MSWFETLVVVLGTPSLSALVVFYTQERLKSALLVSAQNQINEHKQILDTYTESMKHSLQREMSKVEHATRSKFSIYPNLFAKFVKASGAIAGLVEVGYQTDLTNITQEDIRSNLTKRKIMIGEQNRIVAEFLSDGDRGIEAYKSILSELEIQKARRVLGKAKNYWLLNELFISDSVNAKIEEIVKALAPAYSSASSMRSGRSSSDKSEKYSASIEKANTAIQALKAIMIKELEPSRLNETASP